VWPPEKGKSWGNLGKEATVFGIHLLRKGKIAEEEKQKWGNSSLTPPPPTYLSNTWEEDPP